MAKPNKQVAAESKHSDTEEPSKSAETPTPPLTDEVYDQAANGIIRGSPLDYAVTQMAYHFKVNEEVIRVELERRVKAIKELAEFKLSSPKLEPDEVFVNVPRSFNLRLDNSVLVPVKVGARIMKREHAEHRYSKANGVEIVSG